MTPCNPRTVNDVSDQVFKLSRGAQFGPSSRAIPEYRSLLIRDSGLGKFR
jgi:hypothetical protein